jgi:hypothetical protein
MRYRITNRPYVRRKPGRPFAFAAKLTTAQRTRLISWLTKGAGLSYAKAESRILREWGIKTNGKQLSIFWQRYCQPVLLQQPPDTGEVLFEIVIQIRRKKGEP